MIYTAIPAIGVKQHIQDVYEHDNIKYLRDLLSTHIINSSKSRKFLIFKQKHL